MRTGEANKPVVLCAFKRKCVILQLVVSVVFVVVVYLLLLFQLLWILLALLSFVRHRRQCEMAQINKYKMTEKQLKLMFFASVIYIHSTSVQSPDSRLISTLFFIYSVNSQKKICHPFYLFTRVFFLLTKRSDLYSLFLKKKSSIFRSVLLK